MTLPDTVIALIERGPLTTCVTRNPDGGPQVSCVWVGVEDGEVFFVSLPENRKVQNLRRDPRIVLVMPAGSHNQVGMEEYCVLHGRARVEAGGGPERLQRLAHTYVGPDSVFPPMPDPPPGHVIRVEALRFGGLGPWTDASS